MTQTPSSSRFQEVIETVEALPPDDQIMLVEIIRQRLIEYRRAELASDVAESRAAYQSGDVRRGSVADLMEDLATKCTEAFTGGRRSPVSGRSSDL
jgi:hypothetical protein